MTQKLTAHIQAGNVGQRPAKLLKEGAVLSIDESQVKDGTTYVHFTLTPKQEGVKDVRPFTDVAILQ